MSGKRLNGDSALASSHRVRSRHPPHVCALPELAEGKARLRAGAGFPGECVLTGPRALRLAPSAAIQRLRCYTSLRPVASLPANGTRSRTALCGREAPSLDGIAVRDVHGRGRPHRFGRWKSCGPRRAHPLIGGGVSELPGEVQALNVPAIDRLIKVVASGIGSVAGPMLAPWRARREGLHAPLQRMGPLLHAKRMENSWFICAETASLSRRRDQNWTARIDSVVPLWGRSKEATEAAVAPLAHVRGIMNTSAVATIASLPRVALPLRMGNRQPQPSFSRLELGSTSAGFLKTYCSTQHPPDSRQRRSTGPLRYLRRLRGMMVLRPATQPSFAFMPTHRMEPFVPQYFEANFGDYVGKCRSALTQGAASAGGCSALSRAG